VALKADRIQAGAAWAIKSQIGDGEDDIPLVVNQYVYRTVALVSPGFESRGGVIDGVGKAYRPGVSFAVEAA